MTVRFRSAPQAPRNLQRLDRHAARLAAEVAGVAVGGVVLLSGFRHGCGHVQLAALAIVMVQAVSAALATGVEGHFRLAEQGHHVVRGARLDQADADRESCFRFARREHDLAGRVANSIGHADGVRKLGLGSRKARQLVP